MSTLTASSVWTLSKSTGEPRLVALALGDSADSEDWARISFDRLEAKTRIGDLVHLRRALRTLIGMGELRMWETQTGAPLFRLTLTGQPTDAEITAVQRRVSAGAKWSEVKA